MNDAAGNELELSFENCIRSSLGDTRFSSQQANVTSWWKRIVDAYSESQRYYHTLSHIVSMHDTLEKVPSSLVVDKTAVVCAIAFHDIVYDPKAPHEQNELDSLKLWLAFAQETELNQQLVVDVSNMIKSTIHHKLPTDGYPPDLPLFLDLDLEVLGRNREKYFEYAVGIRREYDNYPLEDYCKGRTSVLERLRSGDIFFTEHFKENSTETARDNLSWEIDLLGRGEVPVNIV
ncbi:hypothetical protein FS842_002406 [Serendipita sp. 407]|nr:hypothetical protein FS842_002406 [Serendipita sp. 407]